MHSYIFPFLYLPTLIAFISVAMVLPATRAYATEETTAAHPADPVNRISPDHVRIAVSDNSWRLSVPADTGVPIIIRYVNAPDAVVCVETGAAVPFDHAGGVLTLQAPDEIASSAAQDIVVQWAENRWEDTTQSFVQADAAITPMREGVLFTGSSTARMWPVASAFPEWNTLNRGFGGSQFWDTFMFAHRILGAHTPDFIVLYSGDNDIASGKSPEWALADCVATVDRFRSLVPQSHIIIVGIKGSRSRWELFPAMQQTNAYISDYAERLDGVSYLDLGALLLDETGMPDPACYLEDALHLSAEGYRRWNAALIAHIEELRQ